MNIANGLNFLKTQNLQQQCFKQLCHNTSIMNNANADNHTVFADVSVLIPIDTPDDPIDDIEFAAMVRVARDIVTSGNVPHFGGRSIPRS